MSSRMYATLTFLFVLAFSSFVRPACGQVHVYAHSMFDSRMYRYDSDSNSWSTIGTPSYVTATQFATDAFGNMFSFNEASRRVVRYNNSNNSWQTVSHLPTLNRTNGVGYNLEVTNQGKFLWTEYGGSAMYSSDGSTGWQARGLAATSNLTADYDPVSGRYAYGIINQRRFVELNPVTGQQQFSSYRGGASEYRRLGSIVDGFLVQNFTTAGIDRWNMNNIAQPPSTLPQPSGTAWVSGDVDRNTNELYVLNLHGGRFGKYNVHTGSFQSLPSSPSLNISSTTVINRDVLISGQTFDPSDLAVSRYNHNINSLTIADSLSAGNVMIGYGSTLDVDTLVDVNALGWLDVQSGSTLNATDLYISGFMRVNGHVDGQTFNMSGGMITGNGTLEDIHLSNHSRIAAGNSIGTLTASSITFNNDAQIEFEINDFLGSAGSTSTGWDLLNADDLILSASEDDPILLILKSLAGQSSGLAANFDPNNDYSLVFASTANGISGFDPNMFAFETSGFQNAHNGTWFVSQIGNDLFLNYSAIPEPGTGIMLMSLLVVAISIRRQR